MKLPPCIYLKVGRTRFVCYRIPNSLAEHNLRAPHEIDKDRVKLRHQRLWVNNVEVNVVLCSDLHYLLILLCLAEYLSPHFLKPVILLPNHFLFSLVKSKFGFTPAMVLLDE